MVTTTKARLWRVEWCHRSGYRAPYQVVEAKNYKDAHAQAKAIPCVLSQYSTQWSFTLVRLPYVRNKRNTKWIMPRPENPAENSRPGLQPSVCVATEKALG